MTPSQRNVISSSVTESVLARKLLIQPGQNVLVLNAPPGYVSGLQPLPDGATATEQGVGLRDGVRLFARDRAELERAAAAAMSSLKPGGVLWMARPKPSDGPGAGLSRDPGWVV